MINKWQKLFPDSFLQTFPDDKIHGRTVCKPLKDTTQEECEKLNREGSGIYVTPNGFSSFEKRSEKNCDKINWWFIDIEGYPKEEQKKRIKEFGLEPTMVVETKNGYHVYWKIKGESLHWYEVILKLIDYFSSDFAISSLNEVLRVPDFLHQKDPKNPFKIQLKVDTKNEYTEAEMFLNLPTDPENERKYKDYQADYLNDDVIDTIKAIPIEDVLRSFNVEVKRGCICEGGETTSAVIWKENNSITRFSGKQGSGTAIDVALTWGGAKSVKEAIEVLSEKFHIKRNILEKKAAKPVIKQIFKSADQIPDYIKTELVEDEKILSYGFKELDKATGGIFPSTLAIIGGRSGHGKSDFCRYVAKNALEKGKKVYYFDFENIVGDFFYRELKTALSNYGVFIQKTDLRKKSFWGQNNEITELAQSLLDAMVEKYSGIMLYSKAEIPTFDQFIVYMDAVTDADLIVIDHLHYFSSNGSDEQYKQISDIMDKASTFAKTKNIPIVMASHVKNPQGKERPPLSSDLFGSSNIEKQCEVLIMPYRVPEADQYGKANTKIFIAKNRPEAIYREFDAFFDPKHGCITEIITDPALNNSDPF